MTAKRKASKSAKNSSANLGFEAKLWLAADSRSTAKGNRGDISIYGQEKRAWGARFGQAKRARRVRLLRKQPNQSNPTTRRLAVMNLAIRGIEADIGKEHVDTFRNVQHPDFRTDYVLANPPFNDSDWHRKDDDVRWKYGVPTIS